MIFFSIEKEADLTVLVARVGVHMWDENAGPSSSSLLVEEAGLLGRVAVHHLLVVGRLLHHLLVVGRLLPPLSGRYLQLVDLVVDVLHRVVQAVVAIVTPGAHTIPSATHGVQFLAVGLQLLQPTIKTDAGKNEGLFG